MKSLKIIANIKSDFPAKFGIPRQSNIVNGLESTIIFTPEFRNEEALRGLCEFSHLWIIWGFSETEREGWQPTVRPPKLGGNTRMGVFATRSPFRPNPLGLSSAEITAIEKTQNFGTVIRVTGTDLMDGTPIYDIKPYLPYTDNHPDARAGFAQDIQPFSLSVADVDNLLNAVPENKRNALLQVLSHDPRPSYQNNTARVYGMQFAGFEVKFTVDKDILTIISIEKALT